MGHGTKSTKMHEFALQIIAEQLVLINDAVWGYATIDLDVNPANVT